MSGDPRLPWMCLTVVWMLIGLGAVAYATGLHQRAAERIAELTGERDALKRLCRVLEAAERVRGRLVLGEPLLKVLPGGKR
jgi:hypothetical protein